MIKRITLVTLALVLISSCVSPKIYKDLESKYANLKQANRKLTDENEDLLFDKTKAENELKQLKTDYAQVLAQRNRLQGDYDANKANFDALKVVLRCFREKQFCFHRCKFRKE